MKKFLALSAALMVTACTTAPATTSDSDPFEAQDPLRPLNETIFSFNLRTDKYILRPVSESYHALPEWMRYGTSNFFSNLGEPLSGVNSLLQADFQSFGTTLFRFILNTTFGLGGVRDFAGENGLAENNQGFNDTLRTYGMGTGPYLVLPILGPSSARGVVGKAGDWFGDPVGYMLSTPESIAQYTADGIILRDENAPVINQLFYQSLDPYTATRAAYLQHQEKRRKGGSKSAYAVQ